MLVFMDGIVCILALFTGDIRFQPNGYNQYFYKVPAIVGSVGLLFGFIGLLGVFDDKPSWVRSFTTYLFIKLLAIVVTSIADFQTLRKCDSWLQSSESSVSANVQLSRLAEEGVCPWARFAYIVGAALVIGFWTYGFYQARVYTIHLEVNPPYAIDFGLEKYNADGRWRFYQVKDPRGDMAKSTEHLSEAQEASIRRYYGSTEDQVFSGPVHRLNFGPDGMEYAAGDQGSEMDML